MKRYISYFRYVIRHKWFVKMACDILKIDSPRVWALHDLSKFRPSEFIPYARCFYNSDGTGRYEPDDWFQHAWNHHQKRNRHHWQYWVLINDSGKQEALEMPQRYVEEMVADWAGAGRAITGKWEVAEWYEKNHHKMVLHENTRKKVETLLWVFGGLVIKCFSLPMVLVY